MKKQLFNFTISAILAGTFAGYSQENKVIPCNTYEAMEEAFAKDPQARARYEANQAQLLSEYQQKKSMSARSAAAFVYTVPVVFHILHTYGPENIPDADCIGALAQVNSDLAKMGSDAASVAMPFKNLYINSDIKLMLAHRDPNGNCTSGIVHRYDTRTIWDRNGNLTTLYNGIIWDPTKYLNIIIVKEIVSTSGSGSGIVVGYTYKPGTWTTGDPKDAIVYRYNYLSGLTSRSLTHELGHWLSLAHTFGNTNDPGTVCDDDGLYDTPPTKGALGGCPTSTSGNTCAGATSVYPAGYDNIENIMGYWSCPKNFTTDQTDAMRTALGSVVSGRQNLWQTANLTSTDVNATIPCAPICDYNSTNNSYTVCSGGSLTMKDFSYNGVVTTFAWSASNGGVVASSGSSVTTITFPTVGTSNVTLTVSNAQGTSTKVRTVTVLDATPGITGPNTESFEGNTIPTGWSVYNPNTNSAGWEQTFDAYAYDGVACYYVKGANTSVGQQDILETPIIDIASNSNKAFTFGLAFAQTSSSHNDKLIIQGSKDCGGTWTNITALSASQMAFNSGGQISAPFVPGSQFEWKSYDISTYPNWNSFTNSSSVKLRFIFEASSSTLAVGSSNNIFIDAINLFGSPTSINELSRSYQFNIQPNPTEGEVTVNFKLDDASVVKINVVDMLGKEVLPAYEATVTGGNQSVTVNKNGSLSQGVYFVNLSVNGAKMSKKLIIN